MGDTNKTIIVALIVVIMILLVVITFSFTNIFQQQNQTTPLNNTTNITANSTAVTSGSESVSDDNVEKTYPGPHGTGSYHIGDIVDDHDNLMQLQSNGQWVKIGVAERSDNYDDSADDGTYEDDDSGGEEYYQESSSSSNDKYLSSDDYYVSDMGFVISKDHHY